jgi:hypothetical protein
MSEPPFELGKELLYGTQRLGIWSVNHKLKAARWIIERAETRRGRKGQYLWI